MARARKQNARLARAARKNSDSDGKSRKQSGVRHSVEMAPSSSRSSSAESSPPSPSQHYACRPAGPHKFHTYDHFGLGLSVPWPEQVGQPLFDNNDRHSYPSPLTPSHPEGHSHLDAGAISYQEYQGYPEPSSPNGVPFYFSYTTERLQQQWPAPDESPSYQWSIPTPPADVHAISPPFLPTEKWQPAHHQRPSLQHSQSLPTNMTHFPSVLLASTVQHDDLEEAPLSTTSSSPVFVHDSGDLNAFPDNTGFEVAAYFRHSQESTLASPPPPPPMFNTPMPSYHEFHGGAESYLERHRPMDMVTPPSASTSEGQHHELYQPTPYTPYSRSNLELAPPQSYVGFYDPTFILP